MEQRNSMPLDVQPQLARQQMALGLKARSLPVRPALGKPAA